MDNETTDETKEAREQNREEVRKSRELTPIYLRPVEAAVSGPIAELFASIRVIRGHTFL
jgi:hypothetical protein